MGASWVSKTPEEALEKPPEAPGGRRLGGVLGRLGGVLGRLGGQDPTRARGLPFFSVFSSRFGLIFERFLDGFWDDFSRLFLHYPTRPQHV